MAEEPQVQCERYAELRPEVRKFLESMDEEDVKVTREMLQHYRKVTTISSFLRWLVITAFLLATGILTLGEKLMNALKAAAPK